MVKEIIIGTAAVVLLAASAQAAPGKGMIRERMITQERRIHEGGRNCQLTPHEARRLEREQTRIRHTARRMWSDGRLNSRERHRLVHAQNRADRHIYRLKHNNRTACGF